MNLLCCTFVASMLKYSETVAMPSCEAAFMLRSGKVGAPKTVAPSADASSTEGRIFTTQRTGGFEKVFVTSVNSCREQVPVSCRRKVASEEIVTGYLRDREKRPESYERKKTQTIDPERKGYAGIKEKANRGGGEENRNGEIYEMG